MNDDLTTMTTDEVIALWHANNELVHDYELRVLLPMTTYTTPQSENDKTVLAEIRQGVIEIEAELQKRGCRLVNSEWIPF